MQRLAPLWNVSELESRLLGGLSCEATSSRGMQQLLPLWSVSELGQSNVALMTTMQE